MRCGSVVDVQGLLTDLTCTSEFYPSKRVTVSAGRSCGILTGADTRPALTYRRRDAMMKVMTALLCAVGLAVAAYAAPPAKTDKITATATVGSYTNDIQLSQYGESLTVDRVAIENGTTTNATVYLEFLDITGAEGIASSQSVTAGGQTVVYPRRIEVLNATSNYVQYTMSTLRVRTVLAATNHTGDVEFSVTVE